MIRGARYLLAFASVLALTMISAFQSPGPVEWLRQGSELVGFAALTVLGPYAFPRVKWAVLMPLLIASAAMFQLLQFLPIVPGTPSWSDFIFSAAGVLIAPVVLCAATLVVIFRYVRGDV